MCFNVQNSLMENFVIIFKCTVFHEITHTNRDNHCQQIITSLPSSNVYNIIHQMLDHIKQVLKKQESLEMKCHESSIRIKIRLLLFGLYFKRLF